MNVQHIARSENTFRRLYLCWMLLTICVNILGCSLFNTSTEIKKNRGFYGHIVG